MKITDELAARLARSFDRLEREEYLPAAVFADTENNRQWPGDYPGRVILALVQLARVTGRPPQHLQQIMEELPEHLNQRGHMGCALGDGAFDEQQLAGHGWLLAGILAHHEWSGEPASLELARALARGLYRPLRGHLSRYALRPPDASRGAHSGTRLASASDGWQLSTDVGCAFIALEGLVPAQRLLGEDWLPPLIDEMAERFLALDLVSASAQTHATLTAARNLLAWHQQAGRDGLLAAAERLYRLYRSQAMTENFANFNWFNRPEWTEPCAIVDSFILAVELWKATGRGGYLEDAHLIYYNALGYAQKPHGGFGCDCCVGPAGPELFNLVYDVTWCCNMRGAVGLAYAAQNALETKDGRMTLPFLFPFHAEEPAIACRTGYPHEGWFQIQAGETVGMPPLRWFVPSWADRSSIAIQIGHQPRPAIHEGDYLLVPLTPGQATEVRFDMPTRREPTASGAFFRQFRGPLILGEKSGGAGGRAGRAPLNDILFLTEGEAKADRRRVLFPLGPPEPPLHSG